MRAFFLLLLAVPGFAAQVTLSGLVRARADAFLTAAPLEGLASLRRDAAIADPNLRLERDVARLVLGAVAAPADALKTKDFVAAVGAENRDRLAAAAQGLRALAAGDRQLRSALTAAAVEAPAGEALDALAVQLAKADLDAGPALATAFDGSKAGPDAAAPVAGKEGPIRRLLARGRARLRELGIVIGRRATGPLNAITDVAGVAVGHATIKRGDSARTGVTAVLPHQGDLFRERVPAAVWVLNGNGELTGSHWIAEQGALEVPIMLTNSLGVGAVSQGVVQHMLAKDKDIADTDDVVLPVVGECDDSLLNDARACHVKARHARKAIEDAKTGPVKEGAVGAGTGMIAFGFKAGIGTSSRKLSAEEGGWTVGVLVNNNMGRQRGDLVVDGTRVGPEFADVPDPYGKEGSIVIVIATDAPLDARTLQRLAKRAALGLARTGAMGRHGSGDIVVAFSTGNRVPKDPKERTYALQVVPDNKVNPLFEAVEEAAEEAILNSLTAAETTTGRNGSVAHAIPLDRLKALAARPRREPPSPR